MPDSIRERIMQSFAARLATLGGDGYSVDVRQSVYRARRTFVGDEMPALALWDLEETATDTYGATRQVMEVAVEIHALLDDSNPSVLANRLLADVRKVAETHDATLMALIDELTYTSAAPTYPQDGETTLSVRARYALAYRTARGDPFTIP